MKADLELKTIMKGPAEATTLQELKQMKIWICWRYKKSAGRLTKMPFSIKGFPTGTTERHRGNWVTYSDAIQAKQVGQYDGVGFVIPVGFMVIDLDSIDFDDALAIDLRECLKTYAEYSPSGNGLHFIAKVDFTKIPKSGGKLADTYYCKNPHNHMEIYFGGLTNRYMTYTGNVIDDFDAKDVTDCILTILESYMKKSKSSSFDNQAESSFEDFNLIATARRAKNGAKFIALFDEGNTDDYNSQSEADLALCNILAFYTGGNADSIDRLFRQSSLYREKWDRQDYREGTIKKAIESCNGQFYMGIRPMPPFICTDKNGKSLKVNCPKLAKHIRENLHYIFVKDNAKHGVLRYVYEDGYYKLTSDEMMKGIIKEYIISYDENLLRMADVNEVFQQLATDLVFVSNDDLNADENIINFQNGILKISDMRLLPHSPDYFSTIQIPCEWKDEPSPTPRFDSVMADISNEDEEIEDLLIEYIGVALSNVKGWRMKKALFMVGPGDTGKSLLKSLVEMILGRENFVGIDLKEIEARFGTGNLYNKRLAGSSDMGYLTIDELKIFKKCTGGDSIFAEFKGQNGFGFVYNGLLWFCMNRLPKFGGDDGKWVYNRIITVECKNVIPPEKQDKHMLEKLYEERSGIVYKAIMALKQVIFNGYNFSEPESVVKARQIYMEENNTVIAFFNECMEERQDRKTNDNCTTGKVYKVYKAWCNDNNHGYSKTSKEFQAELAAYLKTPYTDLLFRRNNGNYFRQYTLSEEAKERYANTF